MNIVGKSASAGASAINKNWGAVRKYVRNDYWSAGVRAPHSKCSRNPTSAKTIKTYLSSSLFKIGISVRTSNPNENFGHWSKTTLKPFSYLLPKFQNQLTKNGQNFIKKCFKCFKNWSFQKMSMTRNVPLNWYSSMKKKLRKIRIIFDIENWLWKSKIGNFRSLDLERVLLYQNLFFMKKCHFSLN